MCQLKNCPFFLYSDTTRFILINLSSEELPPLTNKHIEQGINKNLFTLDDEWILTKLNSIVTAINKHLDEYWFDKAAIGAYEFFWNDFCSKYLELTKPYLFGKEGNQSTRENKQKILLIPSCPF